MKKVQFYKTQKQKNPTRRKHSFKLIFYGYQTHLGKVLKKGIKKIDSNTLCQDPTPSHFFYLFWSI